MKANKKINIRLLNFIVKFNNSIRELITGKSQYKKTNRAPRMNKKYYDNLTPEEKKERNIQNGFRLNNDLKLKRAAMVEKLISKILYLKEARDNQGIISINIFEILVKLHEKMESENDKRVIRDEIVALREKIQQDN